MNRHKNLNNHKNKSVHILLDNHRYNPNRNP